MAITSFGVFSQATADQILAEIQNAAGTPTRATWYVDTIHGDNANDGTSWGTAFGTMAQALATVRSF